MSPARPLLRRYGLRLGALVVGAGFLLAAGNMAAGTPMIGRGTWWWWGGTSPLQVGTAVGNPALEDRALGTLLAYHFTWLYESSGTLPTTAPAKLIAWHRRLEANGIGVQLLLSENTWIFPSKRAGLLALVQQRLLDFNAACPDPAGRYSGLHLDIEPHALPEWSTSDAAGKRALLIQLSDTYCAVRQYLDTHGGAALTVQADLPVWFDNFGGTSVWPDAGQRDSWFATLGTALNAISLMAYERTTISSIQNGIAWELANFAGQTRCALEFDAGAGLTWPTLDACFAAAATIEANNGPAIGTDLHSFNHLSDLAPEPALPPWLSRRAWRLHHFATEVNAGDAADAADPDGDGLANLVEYSLGSDPHEPTAPPAVALVGGQLALAFTRMRPATDITYVVERSGDLLTWTPIWSSVEHPYAGGSELSALETVADTEPLVGVARRFLRLRVSAP
jgi:hypothetical protein